MYLCSAQGTTSAAAELAYICVTQLAGTSTTPTVCVLPASAQETASAASYSSLSTHHTSSAGARRPQRPSRPFPHQHCAAAVPASLDQPLQALDQPLSF